MYWSQPTRVDHMCKKMWVGGRRGILVGASLGHPHKASQRPTVARLQSDRMWAYMLMPLFPKNLVFLIFNLGFTRKFGDGPGILGEWMYNTSIF
jgi:hypothetical protein